MTYQSEKTRKYMFIAGIAILFFVAGVVFTAGFNLTGESQAGDKHIQNAQAYDDASRQNTFKLASNPYTVNTEPLESPFVSVAERLKPAVVNISVMKKGHDPHAQIREFGMFREFFRDRAPQQQQRLTPSSGTGVIIDNRGYVLTNNHVVENGEEIKVTLADGEERDAEVIGLDPDSDLALLDIKDVKDNQVAPLGDSDIIRIGDWAIAMGNTLGRLDWTLTVGVVSAKGRSDLLIEGGGPVYQNFIQTDASINFGNSGGPLANIRGEVIGINTAINPNGQGVGFAIPINMAKQVVKQLLEHGFVSRGYLGMVPVQLTPDIREALSLEDTKGVFVQMVQPDTPAEKGGLEAGDVIIAIDGKNVDAVADFRLRVAEHQPGEGMEMTILREGKKKKLDFTLADRSEYVQLASSQGSAVTPGRQEWRGIRVASLGSQMARQADVEVDHGVFVIEVGDDSPARGKIQAGDVIVKVDKQDIDNLDDWTAATDQLSDSDRAVLIKFHRGGKGASRFEAIKD